jgi:hypothetical protein|tara:strand:- start:2326 stop:2595 length:270 start_codon:yes stop_codon:yes gene_type:complete
MKLKFKTLAVIVMLAISSTVNADSLYVDHYKIDQLQAKGWVIPAMTEMHILDLQKAIEKLTTEGWVIPNELIESFRHQLNYVNAGKPPQ